MVDLLRRNLVLSTLGLAACGGGAGGLGMAGNEPPASAGSNPIVEENAIAGTAADADWRIAPANVAANDEIMGYASAASVNVGGQLDLFVSTQDASYQIEVFRIGWYGGRGARLLLTTPVLPGVVQPAPTTDPNFNMVECQWGSSYTLQVPASGWLSGVYLARLVGASGKQAYIHFVVRDDARASAALFVCSVSTYQAYNDWGGYSFYAPDQQAHNARKVSFDRPYSRMSGAGDFLVWEINLLRFLEREGFDVSYSTDVDLHLAPGLMTVHKATLFSGHSEYWSRDLRVGVQAARDQGVHLGFFAADTCYWQVRYEDGASGAAARRVVCYKYNFKEDPLYASDPSLTTCLWRQAPLDWPEASLVGVMYDFNSLSADMVIDHADNWICAGAGVAQGTVLTGLLGYEVDRLDASSPSNVLVIAASPYYRCSQDVCAEDTPAAASQAAISSATFYTAPSGGGVFATGSMQWTWGLDSFGADFHPDRVNAAAQQITRNVLNHFVA